MKNIFLFASFFIILLSGLFFQKTSSLVATAAGDGTYRVSQSSDGTTYVTTELNPSVTPTPTSAILTKPITPPRGFFSDFSQLVNQTLRIVMAVAALLVLAYLLLGAFGWITSGGEKGKIDAAKNKMISAIIGLVILAASYAILTIALNFLGFRDINQAVNIVGNINQAGATPDISPSVSPSVSPSPSPNPGD